MIILLSFLICTPVFSIFFFVILVAFLSDTIYGNIFCILFSTPLFFLNKTYFRNFFCLLLKILWVLLHSSEFSDKDLILPCSSDHYCKSLYFFLVMDPELRTNCTKAKLISILNTFATPKCPSEQIRIHLPRTTFLGQVLLNSTF